MSVGHGLMTAAVGGRALWYLTRASGLVALVLLTITSVLGIVASVGWTTERWPRFVFQDVHRNVSLLCLVFVGIHAATTVLDGFVPIGPVDAFVPLLSPYRPLYVGLGALGLDLLLAVLVTSALRQRIGYGSWRFVHRLAYLCWPVAAFHSLGSGTDVRLPVTLAVGVACTLAVLSALVWRLAVTPALPLGTRALAVAGSSVVALAIAGFALVGPLRPGWSHRAGTSSALLAQLAARNGGGTTVVGPGTTPVTAPARPGAVPTLPFTGRVVGTQSRAAVDSGGTVRITLAMHLVNATSTPLTVVLVGIQAGSGVSLSSGTVTLGTASGSVTVLRGDTVVGTVATPDPVTVTLSLQVDEQTGALSGSVTAVAGTG